VSTAGRPPVCCAPWSAAAGGRSGNERTSCVDCGAELVISEQARALDADPICAECLAVRSPAGMATAVPGTELGMEAAFGTAELPVAEADIPRIARLFGRPRRPPTDGSAS
jgi:hypothetical protein